VGCNLRTWVAEAVIDASSLFLTPKPALLYMIVACLDLCGGPW
jgi:hypothetical protein